MNNDETQLVELLNKLEPGFLPYEVFMAIARLVALPIIEIIPLMRGDDGSLNVLLLERHKDKDLWAGMVHTPGTVIRAGDSEETAFERITNDELNGTRVSQPVFVENIIHKSKRGYEVARVFYVEILDEPKIGKLYNVNDLPENIIPEQKKFIALAVKKLQEKS